MRSWLTATWMIAAATAAQAQTAPVVPIKPKPVATAPVRPALQTPADTATAPLTLVNTDFDTGKVTLAGEYALADETYGEWLRKMADKRFADLSPTMRANILAFYGTTPKTPASEEEKEGDKQRETQAALEQLRALKQ